MTIATIAEKTIMTPAEELVRDRRNHGVERLRTVALASRTPESIAVFVDTNCHLNGADVDVIATVKAYAAQYDTHVELFAFDYAVSSYEPGVPAAHLAGTRLDSVYAVAEGRTPKPGADRGSEACDVNIVVTDGFVPHLYPEQPGKWVFLICDNGDNWTEGGAEIVRAAPKTRFGVRVNRGATVRKQLPQMETIRL